MCSVDCNYHIIKKRYGISLQEIVLIDGNDEHYLH